MKPPKIIRLPSNGMAPRASKRGSSTMALCAASRGPMPAASVNVATGGGGDVVDVISTGDDGILILDTGAENDIVSVSATGAGGGFTGQPRRRRPAQPRRVRVDQTAADVGHHRHAERGELFDRCVLDEAFDAVVARVHLHHHRHVRAGPGDCTLVVGQARPVGGADIEQPAPGLLHHFRFLFQ